MYERIKDVGERSERSTYILTEERSNINEGGQWRMKISQNWPLIEGGSRSEGEKSEFTDEKGESIKKNKKRQAIV